MDKLHLKIRRFAGMIWAENRGTADVSPNLKEGD